MNSIEYGLIASLIAVAVITAVTLVGTNLKTAFENSAARSVPICSDGWIRVELPGSLTPMCADHLKQAHYE